MIECGNVKSLSDERLQEIADSIINFAGTEAEQRYLRYQVGLSHPRLSFYHKLFWLISQADEKHIDKIRLGFPAEVAAYESWTQGDLADRARRAGIIV